MWIQEVLNELNKRYIPDFDPDSGRGIYYPYNS